MESREGGIDGVICLVATDFDRQVIYQLIEESRENHIPLVFMNSGLTDRDIDDVTPDYYQIGALGTEYLLRLGHRRIGFVAHQPGHLSMEERFAGYRDALVKHGCFHEEYVVIHNEDPQSVRTGYWAVRDVLTQLEEPPTAVYAFHENNAAGAAYAAEDLGLHIPECLSLVGTYHNPKRQYSKHDMTSVVLPLQEVGSKAVEILMQRIDGVGPNRGIQIKLPGTLKVGETCRPIGENA